MHHLIFVCRIALASVFGIAALAKLTSRDGFRSFVASLRTFGVPQVLSTPLFGALVIVAELGAGTALVVAPSAGGALGAVLLAGFALGIAHAIRAGEPVRCRCFGAGGATLGRAHWIRNLALAAIAGAVAILEPSRSLGFALRPDIVVTALVGLGAGALITRWDDLVYLFSTASLAPERSASRRSLP
jgi:hypothetical protein